MRVYYVYVSIVVYFLKGHHVHCIWPCCMLPGHAILSYATGYDVTAHELLCTVKVIHGVYKMGSCYSSSANRANKQSVQYRVPGIYE